jgi:hypothetical protein
MTMKGRQHLYTILFLLDILSMSEGFVQQRRYEAVVSHPPDFLHHGRRRIYSTTTTSSSLHALVPVTEDDTQQEPSSDSDDISIAFKEMLSAIDETFQGFWTTTSDILDLPDAGNDDDEDESPTTTEELREFTKEEDLIRDKQDQLFIVMATLPSVMAFVAWEDISHSMAVFLDNYGAIGRNVDGGQFTVTLLRPTITGVVVPVISIALATLVSTTINVLRARQVELRALINKEACELRLLRRAVFGMFGTRQHASRRAKALALMCGYVEQLEKECTVGAVQTLEELQLSGGIAVNELDCLAEMLHGVDGAAASRQGVSACEK